MNPNRLQTPGEEAPVRWTSYLVFLAAVLFFSGIMSTIFGGALRYLDFNTILGSFGRLSTVSEDGAALAADFRGTGGAGVKEGFLMAVSAIPTVMFAMGVVNVVERYDGLRVAQRLLNPLLRPLLGLPGVTGLAMITSMQSSDAGAGMTRELFEQGRINEAERDIFAAFQFTSSSMLTNYFVCSAVFLPVLKEMGIIPLITLAMLFIQKLVAANAVRLWLRIEARKKEGVGRS